MIVPLTVMLASQRPCQRVGAWPRRQADHEWRPSASSVCIKLLHPTIPLWVPLLWLRFTFDVAVIRFQSAGTSCLVATRISRMSCAIGLGQRRELGDPVLSGQNVEQPAVDIRLRCFRQRVEGLGINQIAAGYLKSRVCRSKSRSERPCRRAVLGGKLLRESDVPWTGSSSGASSANSR